MPGDGVLPLAVSHGASTGKAGGSRAGGRGPRVKPFEEMSQLERFDLVEAVEEGRVSQDDPRYVALVRESRQREARELAGVLAAVRSRQFATNTELAEFLCHGSVDRVRDWRRLAVWKKLMSEAEWRGCLAAAYRKRKRQ